MPKPNGKWRIVLDFRGLNAITVKDKYRLPRVDDLLDRHLQEPETMLRDLVNKGWIHPARSAFNNPIFLVPKPNGKWRIVLDFRGLNAITIKDK